MDRRQFLAAVGAFGTAGCNSVPFGSGDTPTLTPAPTPTRRASTVADDAPEGTVFLGVGETYDTWTGNRVTVERVRLQQWVVPYVDEWAEIRGDPDRHFLVVDLATDGFDGYARPSAFRVSLDGRLVSLSADAPRTDLFTVQRATGRGHERVALPIPTRPVDRGAFVWNVSPPVYWTLPDSVLDDVHRLPRFSVDSLAVRGSTGEEGARVRVAVTVTNDGDRAGRFPLLVSLDALGHSTRLFPVAVRAGETTEYGATLSPWRPGDPPDGPVTVTVGYPTDRGQATVTETVTFGGGGTGTPTPEGTARDGTTTPGERTRDGTPDGARTGGWTG